MLPFYETWLPYIYLYGVGGILFLIGLYLTIKHKALNLKLRRHKLWFIILIGGFLWYMAIHSSVLIAGLWW